MIRQLNFKILISLLLIGEILTIFIGILIHMSVKEITMMIIGFFGIWLVFSLISMKIDQLANKAIIEK